jgi:hypothetical protein
MPNAMRKVAKEEATKAVKGHERALHGGKGFKKGGPTSEDRMRLGKNMSRAMNQKTG